MPVYRGHDRDLNDIPGLIQREIQKCHRRSIPESDREQADEYSFTHPYRGVAIVISNGKFVPEELKPRDYTQAELQLMDTAFSILGFHVIKFEDLSAKQIINVMQTVSTLDDFHRESDAFACAIGSHGEEIIEKKTSDRHSAPEVYNHVIYGSDGRYVKTWKLLQMFDDYHIKGLRSKPKMFFIQACRGRVDSSDSKYDHGVMITVHNSVDSSNESSNTHEWTDTGKQKSQATYKPTDNDTPLNASTEPCQSQTLDDNLHIRSAIEEHGHSSTSTQDHAEGFIGTFKKLFSTKKDLHIRAPIPNHFLLMYASASGKIALGRQNVGGWMFLGLSKVMESYINDTEKDLINILPCVASAVAIQMESRSNADTTSGLKTAVCFHHRLLKGIVIRDTKK